MLFGGAPVSGFGSASSELQSTVQNLGVVFDNYFKFDKQIDRASFLSILAFI